MTTTFVIFGASGDLAKKKTFPSLFGLFRLGILPQDLRIVGYARTKLTLEEFVSRIEPYLRKTKPPSKPNTKEEIEEEKNSLERDLKGFLEKCEYISGSYDQEEDFNKLSSRLEQFGCSLHVFYLALPPSMFINASHGISHHMKSSEKCERRIIVEKPFGRDTQSSNDLNMAFSKLFHESQVCWF